MRGSRVDMDREESDAALVAAARAGSKKALALLVTRHWPMLLALCRRTLGEHAIVDDVAQEAVLQISAAPAGQRCRGGDRPGPSGAATLRAHAPVRPLWPGAPHATRPPAPPGAVPDRRQPSPR